MQQIVYISSARGPVTDVLVADILAVSRRNNACDAITGLLYCDARRFLQVLEGPSDAVEMAVARIRADDRHRAMVVLSQRDIADREFGDWSMAHLGPGGDADAVLGRVSALVAKAAPDVRATFESFVALRRAA